MQLSDLFADAQKRGLISGSFREKRICYSLKLLGRGPSSITVIVAVFLYHTRFGCRDISRATSFLHRALHTIFAVVERPRRDRATKLHAICHGLHNRLLMPQRRGLPAVQFQKINEGQEKPAGFSVGGFLPWCGLGLHIRWYLIVVTGFPGKTTAKQVAAVWMSEFTRFC